VPTPLAPSVDDLAAGWMAVDRIVSLQ